MLLHAAALLLLWCPRQDPQLSKTVSFVSPGADVPHAVAALSKASGVLLSAPNTFRSDVVVLRLKDAPLSDAMAKIADLAAGDWVQKDGGYELVRSQVKVRADEKAEFDHEVDMFRASIETKKKAAAKLDPWNDETVRSLVIQLNEIQKQVGDNWNSGLWQKVMELDQKGPGGRAMTRILATLDPVELAKLPADYQTVYSDRPNRLQKPLPDPARQALASVASEQNLWSETVGRVAPDPEESGYYSGNSMSMRDPVQGPVGKALLILQKQRTGGVPYVSVQLLLTDQKGKIIARAADGMSPFAETDFEAIKPKENEKPLKLSPVSAALSPQVGGSNAKTGLPKEIIEQLINPETHEPLGLTIGESLVEIAESRNENLAASLPDEAFMYTGYFGAQPLTPTMLLSMIDKVAVDVQEKESWLVISPKARASSRSDRQSRDEVGKFLRASWKKGRPSLDDFAQLSLSVSGEFYSCLAFQCARALFSDNPPLYYEKYMLRFYATLNQSERQTLKQGGALPLAGLRPVLGENLNKMIFGNMGDLQPSFEDSEDQEEGFFESFYNSIKFQPTEFFANGFPAGSALRLTDESSDVISLPAYEMQPGFVTSGQWVGPDDVAQRMYAKERPGIFTWLDNTPGFDTGTFRFASQQRLNFQFRFGKEAEMSKLLQDTNPGNSEAVPYAALPESFRKAVQAALEELRKQYKDVKPGDLGGSQRQSPPPPFRN